MDSQTPLVLITGVTGYIGSQVLHTFLEYGQFRLRGTVRSLQNTKKIEPLKEFFGDKWSQVELVEADLTNEDSIINACEGCTYVVHTASPVPLEKIKDDNDVILPAVNGTLAVMNGAKKHRVKRVVYTGSTAAVFLPVGWTKSMTHFETSMWRDTENKVCDAYGKSKTYAEQKAWKFVEDLPDDKKIELVTILPGMVFGPSIIQEKNPSSEIIKMIMTGKIPGAPKVSLPMVDVRDVAEAHL